MELTDLSLEQIEQIKSMESIEELKSAAEKEGISVTDEKLACAWKELHEQDAIELIDEELENVAGGGCGKKEPEKYKVFGFWAPSCNGRFVPEIRMPRRTQPCCGNCKHFHPYVNNPPEEKWSGGGSCKREFEN